MYIYAHTMCLLGWLHALLTACVSVLSCGQRSACSQERGGVSVSDVAAELDPCRIGHLVILGLAVSVSQMTNSFAGSRLRTLAVSFRKNTAAFAALICVIS